MTNQQDENNKKNSNEVNTNDSNSNRNDNDISSNLDDDRSRRNTIPSSSLPSIPSLTWSSPLCTSTPTTLYNSCSNDYISNSVSDKRFRIRVLSIIDQVFDIIEESNIDDDIYGSDNDQECQ